MNEVQINLPPGGVPYLHTYLGLWACEARSFNMLTTMAESMDISTHLANRPSMNAEGGSATQRRYGYSVSDGVALVDVAGSMLKHESSLDASTSTVMLRNTARQLRRDSGVKASIWRIDSPGGTVAGSFDLADDVAALSAEKPTHAYLEDLGASAAYLLASQMRSISANRNALVGSIGTYGLVYDSSERMNKLGVKAILISSGGVKGAGLPGTKITAEMVAEWQKECDTVTGFFIDYVGKGRKMSREKAASLANGAVHVGAEAQSRGLIDRVESLDQLFARVSGANSESTRRTKAAETFRPVANHSEPEREMQYPNPAEEANRRIATLKAGGMQHSRAVAQTFSKDPELHQQYLAQSNPHLKPEALRGYQPTNADEAGAAEFNRLVAAKVEAGTPRKEAVSDVSHNHPELHSAYIRASNAGKNLSGSSFRN